MKNANIYIPSRLVLKLFGLVFLLAMQIQLKAQVPPGAINADPSAKAISQVPLGMSIAGNAVLKFRFTNEASSVNGTGTIPSGSVRLTISFPGKFAYTSVNSIPKFVIEDADSQPFGVVHLVNSQVILEGEVIDLLLNVRGTQLGSGSVTFNSDRTTPIIVANTQTSNDNAAATFNTTGITVLPLRLLSFNAQKQSCNADLSWKTSDEISVTGFQVELSIDNGSNFKTIGNITALGGSADRNYSFTYSMQGSQAHLFRLKMMDKDGNFTYSQVARINSGCGAGNDALLVYPSPTRSLLTLNTNDASLVNTRAGILDMSGRLAMEFMITGTAMSIYVNRLTPGIYMLKLSNGKTAKFVKQ